MTFGFSTTWGWPTATLVGWRKPGRHLSEAIRLNPGHVNSRVALGVTYAKEGRNQEAVKILEEAVSAEPNNPWAQRNLGGCLLALKEVDRAISCLTAGDPTESQRPASVLRIG